MEKQDFKFKKLSIELGQFLVTINEIYPEVVIEDASKFYEFNPSHEFISIQVPEEVAVLLKLKFGDYLIERPLPPEEGWLRKFKDRLDDRERDWFKREFKNHYKKFNNDFSRVEKELKKLI